MPIKVLMPALSPTMKEGNLAKWHVKEGSNVSAGDLIAEIETDKATMEVEAVDEGVIGKILVPEGAKNVAVNSTIAVLLEDGEKAEDLKDFDAGSAPVKEEKAEEPAEEKDASEADAAAKPAAESAPVAHAPTAQKAPAAPVQAAKPAPVMQTQPQANAGRVFASPLAKRIAAEKNIDLSIMHGSGPKGRVVKKDVVEFKGKSFALSSGQVSRVQPETSELPLSTMREVIAQRLVESKQTVPHFYLSVDVNMDKLIELRTDINALANKEQPEFKISVNDMIIKASALALQAVPEANASWAEKSITQYNNIDVAVAVAIEGGLITPIVRNADQKSLFEISAEMKELVNKAKSGTLSPEEFQGGGFSVSNLGMYGIKQFNAIINPPQSCILAVGGTREVPTIVDGELVVSNIMTLTISCDHRVVDGAVGANLINAIKQCIESPVRMLI